MFVTQSRRVYHHLLVSSTVSIDITVQIAVQVVHRCLTLSERVSRADVVAIEV